MPLALVDCDSFYASCERIFRPDLNNKPIVVLSNNDGCVIARSKEAKALGVGMGVQLVYLGYVFIMWHSIRVMTIAFIKTNRFIYIYINIHFKISLMS